MQIPLPAAFSSCSRLGLGFCWLPAGKAEALCLGSSTLIFATLKAARLPRSCSDTELG